MAIRTQHEITAPMWFVTFTCYNWLPLFEVTKCYDLLYNWFDIIWKKYDIDTCGFVIMPNHVHSLLYLHDRSVNLNTVISNGKRFIAYEIINRLKEYNNLDLLKQLSTGCSEKEKLKGQLHKVFEPSFDAKVVYSADFLSQKLDYIHHNPVSGKWNLCVKYTDYPHSSAGYYIDDKLHPVVAIKDYRELVW